MNSFKIKSKLTGKIYTAVQSDEIPDAWLVDYGNDYGYVHKDKLFLGFTLVHTLVHEEEEGTTEEAWNDYCKRSGIPNAKCQYKLGWEDGWEEAKRLGDFK
jgi:hypothetical protein